MELVFNEWFVDYMVPGSGHEKLVWKLLDKLDEKRDRLVVRRSSPFTEKLHRYNKEHREAMRPLLRRFYLLMHNPERVRLVEEHEITNLSQALAQKCPPKDSYLIEVASLTSEKLIVTTDARLKQAMAGQGFDIQMLDDFAKAYL